VLVFEHHASHCPVSFASDNQRALIRSEPYLEAFLCSVWRRGDFIETEIPQKCERLPDRVNEFPQRWGRNRFFHHCVWWNSSKQPVAVVLNWTAGLNVTQGTTRVPQ